MPEGDAKIGDAYWVYRNATMNPPDAGDKPHPMACVAEKHIETAWTALPRTSSSKHPDDVPSRAMPEIHATRLDRPGAWSRRWIHSVRKSLTGQRDACEFVAALPDDERAKVLNHYRTRPR